MNALYSEPTCLHDLKHVVLAELVMVGQPERTAGVPLEELLFDRVDADRYELGLHCLLDAVVALERR
ncbi:hypothetical protein Daura_27175 [Dactylosporangium aurantiacum]|uniref:Uncharacterized protein n=2 Tax=Dactylosporangium aurantiacum TaxID=35754 RepID=A0A9Q9MC41_9ACTN|nr:hypothetical protein [Dactylosporangium aurantiacum]MDG6106451.1 hypothetical protein [Dactylosporangium aurantiacum]UWZ50514.1 hypothetical protein Daura_27175 [Dactylosporangium aurantiacum]